MKKIESFVLRMLVVACALFSVGFLEAYFTGAWNAYMLLTPLLAAGAYAAMCVEARLHYARGTRRCTAHTAQSLRVQRAARASHAA